MNNLQLSDTGFLDCPRSSRSGSRLRPAEAFRYRPAIWLGVGKPETLQPVLASLIPTITVVGNISTTSTDWPDDPDFFQIINNAMKIGNGGTAPNPKDVFTVGAAIIDQYDTEDLY